MIKDNDLMKNGSGCYDPTAYTAITNIESGREKIPKLLRTIRYLCDIAGFDIKGRIIFVDKKTGKIWR